MTKEKFLRRSRIYRKIETDLLSETAREIYNTDVFRKALKQEHHGHTSVAVHTICVAVICLRIYYFLLEHHIRLNKDNLLKCALMHDLGIIGRYSKYANDVVCCYRHPIDSITTARTVFPELKEAVIDAILHHMFPMTPIPPHHLEGYILIIADKYCASVETAYGKDKSPAAVFLRHRRHEYERRLRESGISTSKIEEEIAEKVLFI